MGAAAEGLTLAQARKAAVDAVFALNRDVGIPCIYAMLASVKRIFLHWRKPHLTMFVPGKSA
jgi:hypothetical protein